MNTQTIKLTEEETAIIYVCRQKENMWVTWGRVVILLMGAFSVIDGLFVFSNLSKVNTGKFFINETERSLLSMSYITATCILIMGIVLIVSAICHWNGNPNRKLLLKLADRITDQEKKSSISQSP
jgi:hypothetical protein